MMTDERRRRMRLSRRRVYNPQSRAAAACFGAAGMLAKKVYPVSRSSSATLIMSAAEGLRPLAS